MDGAHIVFGLQAAGYLVCIAGLIALIDRNRRTAAGDPRPGAYRWPRRPVSDRRSPPGIRRVIWFGLALSTTGLVLRVVLG